MQKAVGYIRKSRVTTDTIVSFETQEAAIRSMAAEAGFADDDVVIFSDMNISGRKGADKRPGYRAMLDMIETGNAGIVLAYSLSRLSRSIVGLQELIDLTVSLRVPVRLKVDNIDTTTATGRAMTSILGVMAQMEADLASERAQATVATRRDRGDHIGPKLYEDHDTVIAAYEEAGTLNGAARLLNEREVPTRSRGNVWYPSSVRVILLRAAPDLLPPTYRRGVKGSAPFMFYRLLRCWCGETMTAMRNHGGTYPLYRCHKGRLLRDDHGPCNVAEKYITAWVKAEAARLRPPSGQVQMGEETSGQRAELIARRKRWHDDYLEGELDKDEWVAERTRIDQLLSRIDAKSQAVTVEPVDWEGTDENINAALRRMFHHVQLDRNLRPVSADWILPDWRGDEALAAA